LLTIPQSSYQEKSTANSEFAETLERTMPRYYRSIVPLYLISVSLFLFACNHASSPTDSAEVTPTVATAEPLPDVSAMIKRLTGQDGSKDFTAEMRMTSLDQSGKRDNVEFMVQRKNSDDRAATFLAVLSPREDTDKAFLAIERDDQPTEAYSYLAGLRKLTRLSSNRQLGFRGAKVTVQELLGMELNQYTHDSGVRISEGHDQLIKVEFKEKPDLGLAFPRIVGFFRESDQSPVRFELYDLRNELQKTAKIEEVKKIQNYQTITLVSIDDLQQKLKLRLETHQVEYDRGLADRIFTENHLKNFVSDASRKLDQSR
jgi:hypothetical protein